MKYNRDIFGALHSLPHDRVRVIDGDTSSLSRDGLDWLKKISTSFSMMNRDRGRYRALKPKAPCMSSEALSKWRIRGILFCVLYSHPPDQVSGTDGDTSSLSRHCLPKYFILSQIIPSLIDGTSVYKISSKDQKNNISPISSPWSSPVQLLLFGPSYPSFLPRNLWIGLLASAPNLARTANRLPGERRPQSHQQYSLPQLQILGLRPNGIPRSVHRPSAKHP